MKERLNKFTKEAAEVEIKLNKTKETISAADSLVEGLEGEFERWNKEVEAMEGDLAKIPQSALLGAAFLVFLSGATEDVRRRHLDSWRQALGLRRFDLLRFLSSERQVLQWRSEGLPADTQSVENAVCIMHSAAHAAPFLVDPSSRAGGWLRANLGTEESPLEVTTQEDERFVLTLELAVRFGKTLLVQEVTDVSPILYPVLRKDLVGSGPYKSVQIGEKQVDYNPGFRLYLATRDVTAELPPSARALLATVNFATTPAGLTGQLLTAALAHEKPELEKRKSELLKKEEEDKIQISRLEDFLLEQLAGSTGNILENRELLASLNETKHKSAAIEESLRESTVLQEKLVEEGNVYLPVAKFASALFFLVTDLRKLNNMYRFSLDAFLRLFQSTLAEAEHAGSSGDKRIEALKNKLLRKVYDYVSRYISL